MPTIDLDKLPAGTLILVPTMPLADGHEMSAFVAPLGYRQLTPAQLAAELEPKLPAVGSVWRTKGEKVAMICTSGYSDRRLVLFADEDEDGCLSHNLTATEFAAWVRDNGAVCVYDPSKESP